MGLYNLDKIFHPDSIAVVGASEKEDAVGRSVFTNLVDGGFGGDLFPVNPNYDRLHDRRCHARISDAPAVPDLAVIAIPIGEVPGVIDECVEMGVKGAVILSAGGREAGGKGRRLEASIAQKAAEGGLRIIGPNCLGILCPQEGVNASFVAHMPPSGKLAFISQSGAICSAMLDLSLKENMGYRYFVSIGSMLDVDFGDLIDYGKNLMLLQEIPSKSLQERDVERDAVEAIINKGLGRENGMLTECEAKDVLAAYGIPINPTRLAESKAAAGNTAAEIGFPLAMKIASPEIIHKSRAGGVRLGLASQKAVSEAYEEMTAAAKKNFPGAEVQGVTLQPMQTGVELELLIGAKKDANFGPVLLFGWGGVHAEVMQDRNIALVPLNRPLARRLMEDTRVFGVISADEGPGRAEMEALEELLVCLSQLMIDFPQIAELDINPVAIAGGRPRALDARIKVEQTEVASPHHLSISPYPQHLEDRGVRIDQTELLIRPIKPEDAPLLRDLFDRLSKTSIYHRFFSPIKSLPHEMLVRFTQIDYDREIAMVAMDRGSDAGRMLGVARVIGNPGGRKGEFAVLVADRWQGNGIGAELLSRSLRVVQERGMEQVWGTALAENTRMAALARKLGFSVDRNSRGEYEMTIDLTNADLNVE